MDLKPFEGELDAAPKPFVGDLDAPPSRLRRFVADPLISAVDSAISVPETAVGLADIVTGGYAGKGAEALGFKPKEARAVLDSWLSPEQQAANRNVQEADGFVASAGAMLRNPSTIAHSIIKSSAGILGGAGVARGLMRAGVKSAAIAGGVGEGVMSGGSTAEQVRQETPGGLLTPKQAAISAGSGALTSALGVAGGKIAGSRLGRSLGLHDIDTAMAQGHLDVGATRKSIIKSLAGGMFSEGVLEELPQSAQEQAAQNLATGKPLGEGVANSAATGMISGGIMGGGSSVVGNWAAPKAETKTKPADTRAEILADLEAVVATGGEKNHVEIKAEREAAQIVPPEVLADLGVAPEPLAPEVAPVEQILAPEVAPEPLAPAEHVTTSPEPLLAPEASPASQEVAPRDPVEVKAENWVKDGRTISKLDGTPDAEVAAKLDEMGYQITDNGSVRTGGKNVREWGVEKKAPAEQVLTGLEASTLLEGKTEKPRGVDPSKFIDKNASYTLKDIPLDQFNWNTDERGVNPSGAYDSTVNMERATEYAGREGEAPPIIAGNSRSADGLYSVVDGGHRITAARLRGDTSIKALVRVRDEAKPLTGGIPFISKEDAVAAKMQVIDELSKVAPESDRAMQLQVQLDQYNQIVGGDAAYKDFQPEVVAPAFTPLKNGGQRLAYEDNPNLVVGRKDDVIGVLDQKTRTMLAKAEITKDGKLGSWVEGSEPATPAERVQIEGLFRRHLGEDARLNRVYRGDSVNPDGLGEGSMGDLGQGHYFASEHHMAEPFTDGSDKSHTRAFDVNLKKPFDMMGRDHAKDPAWKSMLATLPPDPEFGVKPRALLDRWAKGKLDTKNPYNFLAGSFGQTPETFNSFLAQHGYDGVTDQGIRGISDGGKQYVIFDKALAKLEAERLNRGAGTGIPKADIDAHLKDIIAKLKVPVEVVNNSSEMKGLRDNAPAFNGAFHQGKIYLNAEHITSLAEAEHVLLKHELAHAGLLGTLGRQGLDTVLAKAWGDLSSGVREFSKEKGIDTTSKGGKLEATEEYLVHLAEAGTAHPLWDKFVALLKKALRAAGFEMKYSERELRSLVLDATASMRSDKATAVADDLVTRLSRVAEKVDPKDVDAFTAETSAQVAKHVLADWSARRAAVHGQDSAGNFWRAIMPVSRTIDMAASMVAYAPIKAGLKVYQQLKHLKEAAGSQSSIESDRVRNEYGKVIKTDKDFKTYGDLTNLATLYQLYADPKKASPWASEQAWKDAGQLKLTGKTLAAATAEIKGLWNSLTKAQQDVQQRAAKHYKDLMLETIEPQLDRLRSIFSETYDLALPISETLYKEMWKAEMIGGEKASMELRAQMVTDHGSDVVQIAEQIAAIKNPATLKGDYAALSRFGPIIVTAYEKTAGGPGKRLWVSHYETKTEAKNAKEAIEKNSSQMAMVALQKDAGRVTASIPPEFAGKMRAALEKQGIKGAEQDRVMEDYESARVNTMPRHTLAGNKLQRDGIAGYSDDAMRAYATYVERADKTIANLKYSHKIDQAFRDMGNDIKAYQDPETDWSLDNVERMQSLIDDLYTLEKQRDVERINEVTKFLGKSVFLYYLSSPSVYAVQWAQPFMTTIPKMASRYGFGKAFGTYVKEMKRSMWGEYSDARIDDFDRKNGFVGKELFHLTEKHREAGTKEEKARLSKAMSKIYDRFTPKEQKLLVLKMMSFQGGIDLSVSHSMHDLTSGATDQGKMLNWMVEKGGTFMRLSETGSRRAAAISSFEMALKDKKDFAQANDYANAIINDTLYDISAGNRSPILRGNTGRVLGQFQSFRLHTLGKTVQLAKDAWGAEFKRQIKAAKGDKALIAEATMARTESRKELAYMMATTMAMAGAGGTPLAMLASNTFTDALWDAVEFMFGDPDEPWNLKQKAEDGVRDAVGEDASNVFFKGLPYLLGFDVSKRIGTQGMANMLNGDIPPGLTGTAKANWYAARMLGPSFGIVSDGIRAMDALTEGNYGTAMAAGSPKVLRDFAKAYGVSEDGVKSGGRTILQAEDVSPFSIALQMVGINPAEIALASEKARELTNLSTVVRQRRSLLTKRVTDATLSGDMDAREEALDGINAWGVKNPALKITMQELASAVKRGRDMQAGKLSKRDEILQKESAPD